MVLSPTGLLGAMPLTERKRCSSKVRQFDFITLHITTQKVNPYTPRVSQGHCVHLVLLLLLAAGTDRLRTLCICLSLAMTLFALALYFCCCLLVSGIFCMFNHHATTPTTAISILHLHSKFHTYYRYTTMEAAQQRRDNSCQE